METLKLGFIGAGFIARFQVRALTHINNAELAGVYALEGAEDLQTYAGDHGVGECQVYSSIAELCQNVEAVAIFVPHFARVEVMEEVVDVVKKHGIELKGLICEKPLARSVQEADRMVELANEIHVPTSYHENQVHMKCIKNGLSQLERVQKTMGPIALSRSAEEHAGPHANWFWDPIRQGGGVLADMGCHSIAVSWYILTPVGKPVDFLEPVKVNAEVSLLKWGQPNYRDELKAKTGVDYGETPAEDFTTGTVTFKNPETGQIVKGQFTNSWMYDKQGLRLLMDGLGPGYAFEVNSLKSPLEVFIGDAAAEAVADAESALEKSTASRGLMAVQPYEAELYGYVDETQQAAEAFLNGEDALLNWEYGREITRLVRAAYLSAETERPVDLTDPDTVERVNTYEPLIARGEGAKIL